MVARLCFPSARAVWLSTCAALAGGLAAGCATHPKGLCGPACPTIESATHIIEYPSQRLAILNRVAGRKDLSPHEQLYLVNAIAMGGFSEKVADAFVTLIHNPACTDETCDQIRKRMKLMRLLGRDQRRIIEALEKRAGTASATASARAAYRTQTGPARSQRNRPGPARESPVAPQSWSISPRRLENLVILLLLAASLPPVATYAVWNATERPTLPRVLALAPAPGPSHLPPWLRSAGLCAVWLAANVGTVIPILVLSAALLRFVSVRLTLWLVVAYQCAAAVALSMDAVGELRTLPAAFSLAFPGGYWLTVFRRLLSELASCVLPLALLTCWLGASSRSTGRADSGGCLESPAARAARLTVVTLLVSGAVLLMHGTLQLVVHGLILLHPPVELGTDRLALLADTVLTAAWGILLLVCGLRFERGRRIAPGWLWVALAVNFAGAAAVGATSLAWLYLEGVHDLLTPTRFVRLCLRTFVDIAASWPVVAALLWFWWPALARRAAVDLRDHAAVCQRCGYSLVGNVSGRCPECGLTAT